jgi:predicted nucleic-acid-binding protein
VIGLDTNLLVRYLTQDDPEQFEIAVRVIQENQPCFIGNVILCETVWVLRSKPYKIARERILEILDLMLQTDGFVFEDRSAVYQALQRTRRGRADFSDYLIGTTAYQAGCQEIVTFDQKLKGEKGFRCL